LDAVRAVVDPGAALLNELAGRDHRGMANEGDQITLAASFNPQHAKAVLRVVEGHPVDQVREDLRRTHRRYLRHYPEIIGRPLADSICRGSSRFRYDQTSGSQITTETLMGQIASATRLRSASSLLRLIATSRPKITESRVPLEVGLGFGRARRSGLYRLVWSALRLAARRIIGRVRSASWGMRCD
jgi:hypothetical protein